MNSAIRKLVVELGSQGSPALDRSAILRYRTKVMASDALTDRLEDFVSKASLE